MKKRVLCIFSFLLIALIFLTVISPKVEDEMITLVEARKVQGEIRNYVIGNIAVFWKNSDDKLFCLSEGTGWEGGLRISEIPPEYFDIVEGHVEIGQGTEYWYIHSASREPVAGNAVKTVEVERVIDRYIVWHPDEIELKGMLPNSMNLINCSRDALLISCWSAPAPYFEHSIHHSIKSVVDSDVRIYSMNDIQSFTNALPWISGIFSVLICSLALCVAAWVSIEKEGRRKTTFIINAVVIAALLSILPLLLGQFDLPASLMPEESILDIRHYVNDFSRIISSMDSMQDSTVREWLFRAGWISILVIALSAALTSLLIVCEHRPPKRKREKKTNVL